MFFLDQLRQDTDMGGIQMRYQDKGHAAAGGHGRKKRFKGLQAAGGSAYSDNGKSITGRSGFGSARRGIVSFSGFFFGVMGGVPLS